MGNSGSRGSLRLVFSEGRATRSGLREAGSQFFEAVVGGATVALAFFTCFAFLGAVFVVVAGVVVFCAFLAAGAAIRKGTATTVKRVELISLFILFLLEF
jgi:hypothetical protein